MQSLLILCLVVDIALRVSILVNPPGSGDPVVVGVALNAALPLSHAPPACPSCVPCPAPSAAVVVAAPTCPAAAEVLPPSTAVAAVPRRRASADAACTSLSPKKRCTALTPGIWTGLDLEKQWHIHDDCEYSVSTPFDFLRRFAGKRILLIGDSTTREIAWDLYRVLLGCASFAGAGKYTGNFVGTDVLGTQTEYARERCQFMRHDGTGQHNNMNVTIPVGSTGLTVRMEFLWLQWPSQLYAKPWWNSTIMTGAFDVALVNSYAHIIKRSVDTMNERVYLGEVEELLRTLQAAPELVRGYLKKRFFWRVNFPTEWYLPEYPSLRHEVVKHASEEVVTRWGGAGYPLMNLSKYFSHAACDFRSKGAGCVTEDGLHGNMAVDLVINRELWSVLADTMDAQEDAGEVAPPIYGGGGGDDGVGGRVVGGKPVLRRGMR